MTFNGGDDCTKADHKAILVTGYKATELGIHSEDHPGISVLRYCLKTHMRNLVEEGADWFVISGQAGMELWAGETCLALKEEYPGIRLAVLAPFLNQSEHYAEWMKGLYERVLSKADFTRAISERHYEHPWQLRQKNQFLVDKTDGMLMVYDEETPGSPRYYLEAARRKRRTSSYPVQMINRFDLEDASVDMQQQNPDYWSQS
ncbi:DUF1273 domain-containing protein [Sporolactobacillus sp. THM19-2]|nr:DUF1273 domain-containing protein [Sporolactobacillus sp. THM19-2]